jgi:hypothetical protein
MFSLTIERGYVSATVAAGLLKVSRQRVHQLLKAGGFEGAFLMDCGDKGEVWCIPREAINKRISIINSRKKRK